MPLCLESTAGYNGSGRREVVVTRSMGRYNEGSSWAWRINSSVQSQNNTMYTRTTNRAACSRGFQVQSAVCDLTAGAGPEGPESPAGPAGWQVSCIHSLVALIHLEVSGSYWSNPGVSSYSAYMSFTVHWTRDFRNILPKLRLQLISMWSRSRNKGRELDGAGASHVDQQGREIMVKYVVYFGGWNHSIHQQKKPVPLTPYPIFENQPAPIEIMKR